MSYKDSQGRRWKATRPNGWPIDGKAPDGFTINGYRRVRKDGTFRLVGTDWISEFPAGSTVYTWINDGLGTEVCAVPIDTTVWNPDTIYGDNWPAFVAHVHDQSRIVLIDTERKP